MRGCVLVLFGVLGTVLTGCLHPADPVADAVADPPPVEVEPSCLQTIANAYFRLTIRGVETADWIVRFVPFQGNQFVVVDLEVESFDSAMLVSRRFFDLIDETGHVYPPSLATHWVNDPFRDADLDRGEKAGGRLAFDVPRGRRTLTVFFNPFDYGQLRLCFEVGG